MRCRRLADPDPVANDEVGSPDDAGNVEFEALRRVDAADLPDTAGVARPELGAGDALREFAGVGLRVPRPPERIDANVFDERSVGVRHRPRPTVAGRQSRVAARGHVCFDRGFEGRRIGERPDFELRRLQTRHARLANLEKLVDPVDVLIGSRAAELRSQVDRLEARLVPHGRLAQ